MNSKSEFISWCNSNKINFVIDRKNVTETFLEFFLLGEAGQVSYTKMYLKFSHSILWLRVNCYRPIIKLVAFVATIMWLSRLCVTHALLESLIKANESFKRLSVGDRRRIHPSSKAFRINSVNRYTAVKSDPTWLKFRNRKKSHFPNKNEKKSRVLLQDYGKYRFSLNFITTNW